jgi:hypothetical protein
MYRRNPSRNHEFDFLEACIDVMRRLEYFDFSAAASYDSPRHRSFFVVAKYLFDISLR